MKLYLEDPLRRQIIQRVPCSPKDHVRCVIENAKIEMCVPYLMCKGDSR